MPLRMMSCDFSAVQVDHETHAAGVVFVTGIVESLRSGG